MMTDECFACEKLFGASLVEVFQILKLYIYFPGLNIWSKYEDLFLSIFKPHVSLLSSCSLFFLFLFFLIYFLCLPFWFYSNSISAKFLSLFSSDILETEEHVVKYRQLKRKRVNRFSTKNM